VDSELRLMFFSCAISGGSSMGATRSYFPVCASHSLAKRVV
jgi:hypothetical protein